MDFPLTPIIIIWLSTYSWKKLDIESEFCPRFSTDPRPAMKSPGDTDVISIQKAADILGVTTKTLRRWEAKGVLVPTRTAGNQRRYLVSDIHAFQNKKGAADSSLSPFHTVGLQDSAFRFSSSLSFM